MAVSDYCSKGATKVEEKFKGTSWSTFSLEMKSIFYHLRVDELIYDRKPKPVRPLDATTLKEKSRRRQSMTGYGRIRRHRRQSDRILL